MKYETGRRFFLTILLLLALLGCVLIPVALGTRRWLFVDTPSRVAVNSALVLYDSSSTTYGLFGFCRTTSMTEDCQDLSFDVASPTIRSPSSCRRDTNQVSDRHRASAAMLVLAFFSSLAMLFVSALAFKSSFDSEGATVKFSTVEFEMNRTRSVVIRICCAALTLVLCLCAVAIYGGTFGSWINCGRHFCDAIVDQVREKTASESFPSYMNVQRDSVINCGFGFSFAIGVACCLDYFAIIVFIATDFFFGAPPRPKYVEADGHVDDERVAMTSATAATRSDAASDRQRAGPVVEATQSEEASRNQQRALPPTESQNEPTTETPQERSRALPPATERKVQESPTLRRVDSSVAVKHVVGVSSHEAAAAEQPRNPPPTRTQALPEGDDWEYDEAEQLHWSASQQLYFDQSSGHFFDPASRAWYDPLRERWYVL